MEKYSIGIVTYEKRFKNYFIPLIESIKRYRPNVEITVCINGEYKKEFNQDYLQQILKYVSLYPFIYPQVFTKFTSLAKLWNRAILNSTNDLVLVLNDDVEISEEFFDLLDNQIQTFNNSLVLFNGIFSHFIVDRTLLAKVNWFDERFLGVGKEDRDILKKVNHENIDTPYIKSKHFDTSEPISNMKIYGKKYSKFNDDFFKTKWGTNQIEEKTQYPYYDFEVSNYNLL